MSHTDPSLPVLVTGAGPAGLVIALILVKNGITVRVIEKSPKFHNTTRGTGIQPRSLELFNFLGVLSDIQEHAGPIGSMRLYKLPGGTEPIRTWELAPSREPTPSIPWPNAILHGQQYTEAVLRAHLERHGVQVEVATELVSFEQFPDHVIAHIVKRNDGGEIAETVRAHWLVGADGARGVVRKQLGLSFLGETRTAAEHCVLADLYLTGLDRIHWHMWGDISTTLLVIRPTERSDNSFWIMVGGKDVDHAKLISDRDEFVKFVHSASNRSDFEIGEIIHITEYKPNVRMVDKFGKGRVFVVGDAAHVHSITGGQGLNSSIQDAGNLGWKLALVEKGLSLSSILSTYTSERVPVIAEMLERTTALLNKTVAMKADGSDISAWKRGGALTQIGVNYRWSEIVLDERINQDRASDRVIQAYGHEGDLLQAGDRAPEAPQLKDIRTDAETSLFQIFSATQHTALIFTDDISRAGPVLDVLDRYPPDTISSVLLSKIAAAPASERVEKVLQDTEGHAHEIYSVSEKDLTVFLIRPDGAIGAIALGADGVERYRQLLFSQV